MESFFLELLHKRRRRKLDANLLHNALLDVHQTLNGGLLVGYCGGAGLEQATVGVVLAVNVLKQVGY